MSTKFPPNFDPKRTYPKILDLDKIDVLVDEPLQGKYFTVSNLPSTLTFGKHSFGISLNLSLDENGRRLKPASKVLFEFKDSNGNVIFSDLLGELISDDYATAFVWVKEDPLRIYQNIADGVGTLTIVGELNNVPEHWQNKYNVRLIIPINISKMNPNNSLVIFKDVNKVTASLSEFFAQNEINNNYQYSHLKISASNLDTHAGQVDKIEVAYYQSGSQITASDGSPEYIVHDTITVPRTGNDRVYEDNISASTYSGLNPKSVNIITEMPRTTRPAHIKFRFRYLNPAGQYVQDVLNNNQIVTTDFGFFQVTGSNTVIADKDNLVTGSMYLGKTAGKGLELHGGSAFIRSIGYRGFISGTATPAQKNVFPEGHASGSGFMMWSGSALDEISSGEYSGVGLELVHDSSSYFRFSTAQNGNTIGYGKNRPAGLDIRTNAFFVGKIDGTHISASQGKISISSSNFALSPEGNVTMSGEISASSGHIGNFQIIDGKISGSNITLDAVSASIYMTSKPPGSDPQSAGLERLADEFYIDFTPEQENPDNFHVKFGPNFSIDKDGVLFASGAKFEGTITASAGVIGDFNIGSASIFAGSNETTPRFFLSGSPGTTDNFNKDMLFLSSSGFQINNKGKMKAVAGTIGSWDIGEHQLSAGSIRLNATSNYIEVGGLSSVDDTDTNEKGIFINGTGDVLIRNLTNYLRFKSGKLEISSSALKLDTSGNLIASGTLSSSFGNIGGWTIGPGKITSSNLIIDSTGTLQTSDYVTGQKGWKITSGDNGKAEFENVVIRGTLASTTFEKETVNAVGGQLYVANSTVITGSGVALNDRTMSVVNVSGFSGSYGTGGEILSIKKATGTGFSTEYVLLQSASFDFPSSNSNFAGKLYVKRGYSGSLAPNQSSSSLGDSAGTATAYSASQVITSTGRSGSGYIRITANPNDTATPYIDIVERTGSSIYDVSLKARLGDLSGVANTGPVPSKPGFGLYSENVYLSGTITASAGQIGNWDIDDKRIIKDFDDQSGTQGSLIMSTTSSVVGNTFNQDTTWLKGFSVRTRASNNTWAFQLGEMFLDSDGTKYSGVSSYAKDKWFGFQAVELGSDGVDSELFTLAADTTDNQQNNYQARIAGWNFTTTEFYNSHVTMSNAKGGFISLNNDAILLSGSGEGQLANGGITFDKNNNLTVSGTLSASFGNIGGWKIEKNAFTKGTNMVISASNPRITINDTTFGNEGIQLEYNSGNPRFHIGEGGSNATGSFIKYEGRKVTFGSGVTLGWGASGGEGVNLINTDDWRITSGSMFGSSSDYPANYSPQGTTINGVKRENVITESIGPGGKGIVKAWGMIPNNDYSSDGGWVTNWVPINNRKTYAFIEYVQFKHAMTGSFYFGLYAGKDKDNDGVLDTGLYEQSSSLADGLGVHDIRDGQATSTPADSGVRMNTNPYFFGGRIDTTLSQSAGIEKDKWYLCVGYVHPHDTENRTNYGGMYDVETGAKKRNLTDFKWSPSSSVALHRTYHYYNTEGNNDGNIGHIHQLVTQPGIYEVNGGQVDISNFIDIGSAVAKGTYSGSSTFINQTSIFSPIIGGNTGYFNETFRVGESATGIHITGSGTPNIKSGDYVTGHGGAGWIIDSSSAEFNSITVRGTVSASAGEIGGLSISSTKLSSGNLFEISASSTSGELFISSSNFKVSNTGNITASNVNLSGVLSASAGLIGGFTTDANHISANSDKIVLDSAANNGEIRMGGATNLTNGNGFYANGNGSFRAGDAADNFIKKDGNGLQIKSDPITLDSDGNLTISGTLSSSIGNIGGWTLGETSMSNAWTGYSGIKLARTEGIVGKGTTKHTYETHGGWFFFDVGHISIPPGSGGHIIQDTGDETWGSGDGGIAPAGNPGSD